MIMKRCNNCFELLEDEYNACPYCGYIPGKPPEELYHLYPSMVLANRYIIGKVLGFGGFGITYKAWDKKLESVVAIKEYYPSGIVNRTPGEQELIIYAKKREREFYFGKERFLEEAKNMAKFNSEPNIVNVFEYFEANNTAYIVMEYLDGISLKSYLSKNGGKLDVDTAMPIMDEISKALTTIHNKGIIHRDISPDNIFLCKEGAIKLIDFGAARFSQNESKMMTIILKPGFAPPEQYEKVNKQGPWTDVYALGATYYYIITGIKPEESTNRKVDDKNEEKKDIPYPHEIDPKIPEYISNAIMKAMAIDIELRFRTVAQFSDALHQQKTVLPVAVEKKKRRKRRNIGVSVAVLVLLFGVFASGYKWSSEKEKVTLPDSTVRMWYCKSGDSELDDAEEAAYQSLIEEFNTGFPNVEILLTGFEKNEYIDAFLSAGDEKPNFYEYDDIIANVGYLNEDSLLLESIYSSDEAQRCSLLRYSPDYYGDYTYLPLGFDVPIAFFNKKMNSFDHDSITTLNEFKKPDTQTIPGENKEIFEQDDKLSSKMFDDADGFYKTTAESDFCNGDVFCYGTWTDKYLDIRSRMAGRYSVLFYDTDKIYCKYSNVWRGVDIDKKSNKATIKFLTFMLNDNAQDIMHVQNKSIHLSLNDNVLDNFSTFNSDFEGFFKNKDKYVFEK